MKDRRLPSTTFGKQIEFSCRPVIQKVQPNPFVLSLMTLSIERDFPHCQNVADYRSHKMELSKVISVESAVCESALTLGISLMISPDIQQIVETNKVVSHHISNDLWNVEDGHHVNIWWLDDMFDVNILSQLWIDDLLDFDIRFMFSGSLISPNNSPEQPMLSRATDEYHPHAKFTASEEMPLLSLVGLFDSEDWPAISLCMPGRNAWQCKQRWFNDRKSTMNTTTWTLEEDTLFLEKQREYDSRWMQIAKFFPKPDRWSDQEPIQSTAITGNISLRSWIATYPNYIFFDTWPDTYHSEADFNSNTTSKFKFETTTATQVRKWNDRDRCDCRMDKCSSGTRQQHGRLHWTTWFWIFRFVMK